MPEIESIHARQVLDSRGHPTVEVEVRCRDRGAGRAIVPAGASRGKFEAVELRDGDPSQYGGLGVTRAVANVNTVLAPAIRGTDVTQQEQIDRRLIELDGTPNKSRLGANAILGVSLACAHAAASVEGVPLYRHIAGLWEGVWGTTGFEVRGQGSGVGGSVTQVRSLNPDPRSLTPKAEFRTPNAESQYPNLPLPMINMISGGLHAGGNLEFQDFLIIPIGAPSYHEALHWAVLVYRRLGARLREAGYSTSLGDEGGYAPQLASHEESVELILRSVEDAGLAPGRDVALALDVASSHFHDGQCYRVRGQRLSADEMIELLADWVERYPIVSIEDGLAEEDWDGWKRLTARLGQRVQLIGDDLFVTNPERLRRGIVEGVANAILIKLNQIGTLWETLEVMAQAVAAGYSLIVSARSGETEDTTIADLAVGTGAGQIKIGSVARSERLAKYNQLLRIEEDLTGQARKDHPLMAPHKPAFPK